VIIFCFWLQAAGCKLLAAGCWLLAAGCRLLALGHRPGVRGPQGNRRFPGVIAEVSPAFPPPVGGWLSDPVHRKGKVGLRELSRLHCASPEVDSV